AVVHRQHGAAERVVVHVAHGEVFVDTPGPSCFHSHVPYHNASMRTLEGRCALITGSTQGLGLAAAQRFAAAGCNVVISGLAAPRDAAATAGDLAAAHGVRTVYAAGDLSRPAEIDGILDA